VNTARLVSTSDAEVIERSYGQLMLLTPRGSGLQKLQVLRMVIRPGGSTKTHYHLSEEVFAVIRGRINYVTEHGSVTCEAGGAVIAHSKEPHRIANASKTEEAEIVLALSPPRDPSDVVYIDEP
jgi:mannose-6-phosphate isomerase-like protein (cupin superfamily)